MDAQWREVACALCGTTGGRPILEVPHPDAPNGISRVVRCESCGLRRLNPRPDQSIIGRYYGDDYNAFAGRRRGVVKQAIWDFLRDVSSQAPGRGRRWRFARPLVRPLAEWAFDINVSLHERGQLRVLEVGCGYGDLLMYLQSRSCEVLGVDRDARTRSAGTVRGIPIHIGELRTLQLPDAVFDVAILCHSLEHLPDPARELRELARLVRPGGHLHVAVPNGDAVGLRLQGAGWPHLSHPVHFWFFDTRTLTVLLERCGFVPVRAPYSTSRHHYVIRWLHEMHSEGVIAASRRFWRYLGASAASDDGGDVLRVVARRLGSAVGSSHGGGRRGQDLRGSESE